MSAVDVATGILVALGVAAELVCCAGLASARTTLARLHYTAAGSSIGPTLVAVAVGVEEGLTNATLVAFLVALLMLVLGTAAAHATAVHAAGER